MKAAWNDVVIAESDDTIIVEGNHYFPAAALKREYLLPSETTTNCHWKGVANYYTLQVSGRINRDAVWYYAQPKRAAAQIKDRVAFWNGVRVQP